MVWALSFIPDSTKYTGEWQNDLYHGKGTLEEKKGEGVVLYKGNFVEGKKEGEGELNLPDGNRYT